MNQRPAFQWYPKDYLTDINVVSMTLEEEGAYRRLIDYCWLNGTIPADTKRMAPLCKCQADKMAELWPAIEPCFRPHPKEVKWLIHPRLERERIKQDEHLKKKSRAGKAGAKARWGKDGDSTAMLLPIADDSSPSSSPSPSPSSTPAKREQYCTAFEAFWETYPERNNSGSKSKASELWERAVSDGVEPGLLEEKVGAYAEWCALEGIVGTGKVAMATTWLNQKRWEEKLVFNRMKDSDRKLVGRVQHLEGIDLERSF